MAKLTLQIVRDALPAALGSALSYFQGNSAVEADQAAADAKTEKSLNTLILNALAFLTQIKPLRAEQNVMLTAAKNRYDLPANTIGVLGHDWGKEHLRRFQPWQPQYPKFIPSVRLDETQDGPELVLTPAPTANLINQLTTYMKVDLTIAWRIDTLPENGTVDEKFLPQVLSACQMAAMKHIMVSKAGDPMKIQSAKNLNPAAVHDRLKTELEDWAA